MRWLDKPIRHPGPSSPTEKICDRTQGAALGDGSAGAPCERHSGNAETDGIVRRIAEEIERVGLQGR